MCLLGVWCGSLQGDVGPVSRSDFKVNWSVAFNCAVGAVTVSQETGQLTACCDGCIFESDCIVIYFECICIAL